MVPILLLIVTLAWLVARWRQERRGMALLGHAGDRTFHLPYGVDCADHTVLDAGGAEHQFYPHSPSQGLTHAPRHLETRHETRDAAGPALPWACVCGDDHWVGGDRQLFFDRRDRHVFRQLCVYSRLFGDERDHYSGRRLDHFLQPSGGRALCMDRSEDPLFGERKITCFPILHL